MKMLKLRFACLAVAAIASAPAFAASVVAPMSVAPQQVGFEQVQYGGDQCGNWQRECARLWGFRTQRWHQCMGQPAAIYDCGGGGYGSGGETAGGRYGRSYGGGGGGRCENWRHECARLHGNRTPNWHACMRQPGARRDCD